MSSDIMHDFVAKEITALYSSFDGWKLSERATGNGYDRIAILERRNNGHRECTKMLVTFSHDVPVEALEEIKKPEKNTDGTITRHSCAVMLPANANAASVPEGIPVYSMRSFAFEGKALAWTKKPVRKEDAAKVAA
ncbi:MAG: hypothetical protein GYA23_00455 [Methanomicrobiales archaeon]|nr:hypothetical protein [Methanomicrobiales archaeon]